jgi:hypothetical protein
MRLRVPAAVAVVLSLVGCQHRASRRECFDLTLDDVVVGASLEETWERAREHGWKCSIQSSPYAHRFDLICAIGVGSAASEFRSEFLRGELVSARFERSLAGPRGHCPETELGFERWRESVLKRLRGRLGPPTSLEPRGPKQEAEAFVWRSHEDEIELTSFAAAQRLSLSAADVRTMGSHRLSDSEFERLIAWKTTVTDETVAEEVLRNLSEIAGTEMSHYSEFGKFVAAPPYPPESPRGSYVEWRTDEAVGFSELGFAPSLGSVSCSYAVTVEPQSCAAGECAFTAAARCDPKGTGELVHWAFVHRTHEGLSAQGPFPVCRASGVYSPVTGEAIGYDRVGLCEAKPATPKRSQPGDR